MQKFVQNIAEMLHERLFLSFETIFLLSFADICYLCNVKKIANKTKDNI